MSIGLSIGQSFFVALPFAYATFLVINYWVSKIVSDFSILGMFLTLIITYAAFCLLILFAPEAVLVTALIIILGIIMLTLLIFWIAGR